MGKSKVSTQNMFNIFKLGAAGGAGIFAGQVPQMLLGAFILYIGLMIRKKEKTTGTVIAVIGAILMGNVFTAGNLISNSMNA